ncbi:DNA-protecting protein DprA [Candidatus Peregrinibacteria bacterium]|jgi:DNA processing protein|nr:DNA-protecting protein DprA [Candidatus Peregrinibacteria bacterium]
MKNTLSREEKIYLNALKLVFPYNNAVIGKLINQEKSADYLWNKASKTELLSFEIPKKQIEKFLYEREKIDPMKEFWLLEKENIDLISRANVGYPTLLDDIYDAPEILYLQGKSSLLNNRNIAMVGARAPSKYGPEIVEKIVKEFVSYNFTVVSGLAMGIDSAAHEAAVENGLPTIAVLGAGHGSIKGRSHFRLFKELIANQLIISEYPYNIEGAKHTFPARNRIISGLSLATIIIEAKERSGSLITAKLANDQRREIFAVPGSLFNACSRGTNRVIQKGEAELFIDTKTMVERINFNSKLPLEYKDISKFIPEDELAGALCTFLSSPRHLGKIIENLSPMLIGQNPTSRILQALTELELTGFIKQADNQIWVRD